MSHPPRKVAFVGVVVIKIFVVDVVCDVVFAVVVLIVVLGVAVVVVLVSIAVIIAIVINVGSRNLTLNFGQNQVSSTGCLEKNVPQFLLNFSGYKPARWLRHDSLEWWDRLDLTIIEISMV